MKKGIALLIFLLSVSTALGSAKEPDDVQELAEKYRESKQIISDAEAEKRRVLGSLYSINKRMKKISREKSNLSDELLQAKENVKNLARLIAGLEEQIGAQKKHLRRRLKALYQLSGQGYLAILFSHSSASDLDRSMKFLKIVTERDYQLIRSYQINIANYKEQRNRLREEVQRLVKIERGIRKREGELLDEQKSKSKIVSELDREKIQQISQLRKIRSRSRDFSLSESSDEKLLNLFKPSFFEQKGRLSPPVQGIVVQEYGLIRDEQYKIQLAHKGWQFSAPKGTAVAAVFDGTVIHSSWVDGFGQTLIVDHGDHYYTVYSHLENLKVKPGDQVKRKTIIGAAGGTSQRYGEGIYFEIRHFSEPENPAGWLNARGLNIGQKSSGDRSDWPVAVLGYQEGEVQ